MDWIIKLNEKQFALDQRLNCKKKVYLKVFVEQKM